MTGIPVFWLEPTGLQRVWLRRHRSGPCGAKGEHGFHDARALLHESITREVIYSGDVNGAGSEARPEVMLVSPDDARWPSTCESCGAAFSPTDDPKQLFASPLYRASHTGQLFTLSDAPVGAMWDASWFGGPWACGPDGIHLVVKTPGGEWLVDAEASNCTRPQDSPVPNEPGVTRFTRSHYCWIRHGNPREPATLHIDKNGDTCAAGAGSIQIGGYHGFLHNGHLVPA